MSLADIVRLWRQDVPVTDECLKKADGTRNTGTSYASVEVEARDGAVRIVMSIESNHEPRTQQKAQPEPRQQS